MTKQEVVDKVQKLLSLATSSNENEAQLASSKVQELLTLYGMSLTDVEVMSAEMVNQAFRINKDDGEFYSKRPEWLKRLGLLMKKYYYVHPVWDGRATQIHFLGEKTDVEVAVYLYTFLIRVVESNINVVKHLCKVNKVDTYKAKTFQAEFAWGMVGGIEEKIKEMQPTVPTRTLSGTELIVIKQKALNPYVKQEFPFLSSTSIRASGSSAFAGLGHSTGKNVNIRTGLGGRVIARIEC